MYLGVIRTPFNKQKLVEELSSFIRKKETRERMIMCLDGFDRVYIADPFGNRIELMQPAASSITARSPARNDAAWSVGCGARTVSHPLRSTRPGRPESFCRTTATRARPEPRAAFTTCWSRGIPRKGMLSLSLPIRADRPAARIMPQTGAMRWCIGLRSLGPPCGVLLPVMASPAFCVHAAWPARRSGCGPWPPSWSDAGRQGVGHNGPGHGRLEGVHQKRFGLGHGQLPGLTGRLAA